MESILSFDIFYIFFNLQKCKQIRARVYILKLWIWGFKQPHFKRLSCTLVSSVSYVGTGRGRRTHHCCFSWWFSRQFLSNVYCNGYGTHSLVYPSTQFFFSLNTLVALCVVIQFALLCLPSSPSLSHNPILSCWHQLKVTYHGNTGLDCTWVKGLEFTGSSQVSGGWREAPLCEAQGQTANWKQMDRVITCVINVYVYRMAKSTLFLGQ